MKKFRNIISIILPVILIITIQTRDLFPDFILDEEEKPAEERKPAGEKEKYSKYIAKNIRTEIIPDIKGAVRITWDFHKESDDDYIVGRSMIVPDTVEKALKAVSIKLVPSGAKGDVIDSNLKAGAYYYCILAKSRIMDKAIELHAGQNYTIIPAIIEAEPVRETLKSLPQQISLIYARIVNNSQVRITWRGIETRGIVYTVYRGNAALDSPSKLAQAEKLGVITDSKESFIDNKITKSGTYFYAITTKDITGGEDLNLIPDQSFTITGIFVSLEIPSPVNYIFAVPTDNGVRISWNKTSSGVAEYLVYRYSNTISDSDRISLASFLGKVPANDTVYFDRNPGEGNFYYAVLTRFLNGKVLNDLVKGENYTVDPVVIGSEIKIVSLDAGSFANNIELTWKISGNLGTKNYKIFRKKSAITSPDDLEDAEIAAYVNIYDSKYIDKNLGTGRYYYAIVPKSVDSSKDFSLASGINVTEAVIEKKSQAIINSELPQQIKPEAKATLPTIIPQQVLPEKKYPVKTSASKIDSILQDYFFTGKYYYALVELHNYIKKTDNRNDTAKAKFFIGRTLIELNNYEEAVKYLILKDVNEQYPKAAKFWREYAISKISDDGNYIINDNLR
ncbi:MAG: hypothetical protein V1874_08610 [Spirochaetota bacterium]